MSTNTDLSIGGCTAIIQSGQESTPNLAVAFTKRCSSHISNKSYAQAIADCSEAIRLDPYLAAAFGTRCHAYFNRADYDHAIADCREFGGLDPGHSPIMLSKDQSYKAPDATVCVTPESVERLVAVRNAGDWTTCPDGCGKGDIDYFVPQAKLSTRLQDFPKASFISGITLRKEDNKYVRIYVLLLDHDVAN